MQLLKTQYESIRNWMYRNARPLDLARWKYHFEYGSKQDVLTALKAYQNDDGGFGHALEADSWNPNSSPIQTWCATEILYELGITDKKSSIVEGILSYLYNSDDYKNGYWYAEIPSNNDYPHAPWWSYENDTINEWNYNPTICLAGFILYLAEEQTPIYERAKEIAKKAVEEFLEKETLCEMHEGLCFIRLWEYCKKADIYKLVDMDELCNKLVLMVKESITQDLKAWESDYVCKPSQFFYSKDSVFYLENKEIAKYEIGFIINSLNPEGYWNINWSWNTYQNQWAISENWWKANRIIANMRYLKGFGCL